MIDFIKDFSKFLTFSHIGRLCLGAILLFFGGLLYRITDIPYLFYAGLALFIIQTSIMFFYMIVGMFYDNWKDNDWL